MNTAEDGALRKIDSLAEEAYELRYIDATAALTRALLVLERAERVGYQHGIARALVAAAAARGGLADLDAAAADLDRAHDILDQLQDAVGKARAISGYAMIARRRADYPTSMRLATEALALFWSAGDRRGEADVLRHMGTLHLLAGEFVSALDQFAETHEIMEELDDQHGLALCANDMAVAFFELGEYDTCRQLQEEALAHHRRLGAVSSMLPTLSNLGIVHHVLGDPEGGLRYLHECISVCRHAGERLPEARALYNLGRIHRQRGEMDAALAHFAASEEISRTLGERRTEIGAVIGVGLILLSLGDVERAMDKLSSALSSAESSGIQRVVAEAHQALAEAYERKGDPWTAIHHLKAYHQVREAVQQAGAALRTQHRTVLAEMKRRQQEAESQVLKAQLQPHFLLNTLHSVAMLIQSDSAAATNMVVQLGDLLRLALTQSSAQCTTLDSEIEFVTAYLQMEKLWLGERFRYSIQVEPGLGDIEVPHLLLQPLAENSIRHGFGRGDADATLEIRAERASGDRLLLVVRDTGVGLPTHWSMEKIGVGLRNTRRRLQRLYGLHQELSVRPHPAGGTVVEIHLPIS